MKRLIHAMAALGAALVFGCAGAPETPSDGADISSGDTTRDTLEGADIGQVEQAVTDCQYMGEEVKPDGSTTGNECWSTFAHEPYFCGIASLYARTDSVKWAFATDRTECASQAEPTGFGPMFDLTSITAGINSWASGTGLVFTQTTDPSSADIVIGCAKPSSQAVGDNVWGSTGPYGNVTGNDPLGQWGVVQKPAGATNPQSGIRIPHHRVTVHDLTIIRGLDACAGAVTGTARQNNMHHFMTQLIAHEVGHVLGFGDYNSLGTMSAHQDVCSAAAIAIPPAELVAAAGSMRGRWALSTGGPNASPCQNVPVPLKGGGASTKAGATQEHQYGATTRDMIESGAWDSGVVSSKTLHGSTLKPSGGTLTPDVTDGATGTSMSLPPTDYGLPPTVGTKIAYTDNMTFGIQTGSSHLSCNWSSTSQQCTHPHTYVFDWCFKPGITDAQFKADFRQYTGLNAAQGSWDISPSYGDAVFRFHNSCDDVGVNLVVDNGACSGTNSANIDGYVCLGLPTLTVAENIINDSGFTAPGTYYDWQRQPFANTWMELHIDAADIAARVGTATDRTNLFRHAVQIGLLWTRGIGSRTDVADKMTSRAVLPYAKFGTTFFFTPDGGTQRSVSSNLTPGEYCRAYYHSWPSSFVANYPKGTSYITRYCGSD